MQLNVTIDSAIRFDPRDLTENILNEILGRLKIPNPQRELADKEMLYDAKSIPEFIELWKFSSYNELVLPRGFIFEFEKILNDKDIKVKFKNEMVKNDSCEYHKNIDLITLRDYQDRAVSELFLYGSGVYKSSTGSGKTITMLELIRCCGQKTLVICEKNDIQAQWYNTAFDLGFGPCSLIKNGEIDDRTSLVIALRQTLYSANLDQGFFDQWGCIILDENHHSSSESMFELLGCFPAYYRFGCSATPDSDEDLFPIARSIIGPVVHSTPIEEIGDHLVIPSVKVVKTEFDYPYRPTRAVTNEIVKPGTRVIRNNYNDMMAALENDKVRNIDIVSYAHNSAQAYRTCLVLSKRKKHLDNLYEVWNYMMRNFAPVNYDIFFLTGENSKEYNIIKDEIELSRGCIIFSTLAEEGTDIPKLDRLFLAYPGRKLRGYQQAIGRIMRPHPGKKDAIVYDFRDYKVPLLNSQFRDRNQRIYHKKNYKVENING